MLRIEFIGWCEENFKKRVLIIKDTTQIMNNLYP